MGHLPWAKSSSHLGVRILRDVSPGYGTAYR
jgi:hypothetical protein